MKRVRITYQGAYHHVMSRGYDGNNIFAGNKLKSWTVHNPARPEPKSTWPGREITNKPQSRNYKLQIKGSPSGKLARFYNEVTYNP